MSSFTTEIGQLLIAPNGGNAVQVLLTVPEDGPSSVAVQSIVVDAVGGGANVEARRYRSSTIVQTAKPDTTETFSVDPATPTPRLLVTTAATQTFEVPVDALQRIDVAVHGADGALLQSFGAPIALAPGDALTIETVGATTGPSGNGPLIIRIHHVELG